MTHTIFFSRPDRSVHGPAHTVRAHGLFMLLAFSVACGSSAPAAPTPSIPQVAGSYVGTVTITYPQFGVTLSCPASTTVVQTGAALSIAPLAVSGQCGTTSVPMGNVDIDSNGSIGNDTGTINEPSCGVYTYSASGGFFGRQFQFAMTATSSTCVVFSMSGTLTR